MSLILCSCSVSVIVINQNCKKTGFFLVDPQFFKADAPFVAYFLLQDLFSPTSYTYLIFLSCDNNQNGFHFTGRSKIYQTTSQTTVLKERLVKLLMQYEPINTVE